jgi:hypothetical protein
MEIHRLSARCTKQSAESFALRSGTDYSALRASPLAMLGAALQAFAAVSRRRHGDPDDGKRSTYCTAVRNMTRESVQIHGVGAALRSPMDSQRPETRPCGLVCHLC